MKTLLTVGAGIGILLLILSTYVSQREYRDAVSQESVAKQEAEEKADDSAENADETANPPKPIPTTPCDARNAYALAMYQQLEKVGTDNGIHILVSATQWPVHARQGTCPKADNTTLWIMYGDPPMERVDANAFRKAIEKLC